ncbi:hypothetical protein V8G54_002920 [Vigna mungo]|uniref:SWIM-type domain-containing protein n=1 Tax=Vigna mungo TaxID=3915 RepID=A0AAQ3SD53_VIGMU
MVDERIKVLAHHTGHFVTQDNGNLKFDGEIAEWSYDPDLWSYFKILASVKALGHMDIKELWYNLGGASIVPDRLELLTDDMVVMHMLNIARLNDEVHLYVVHNTMEPNIIEMIDWVDGDVNDEVHVAKQVEDGEGKVQPEVGIQMEEVQGHGDGEQVGREMEKFGTQMEEVQGHGDGEQVGREMEEGEGEIQPEIGTQMEEIQGHGDGEQVGREMEEGEGEVHDVEEEEVHDVEEVEVHDLHDFELQDDEGGHKDGDEGGHDGDDEGGHDVDDEDEDEDDGEYENVDVKVECDIKTSKGQPCSPEGECSRTTDNDSMHDVRGLSDIEWVSDELDSGPDSENDDASIPKTLFPTFTMPKSLGEYKWEVGTYFTEKKEFTDAIRTYALSNDRNLKLIKNDKKRVTIKCLGGNGKCKWYAYCAYMCGGKSWQLRKVIDDVICSRDFNVKLISPKWLSERMEKTVRENHNIKVMDIRDKLSRKWNVGISRNMAFRAKSMAKYNVEESFKEQFRRLHDFGHELLQRNPGSTACKDSFLSSRPIIGLGGCFLKGKYGGELLTTVGRDGNEQILPIAYVVVEVENKDSWTWFLDLLIQDLGGEDVCSSCTLISDQQKGLLQALQDLLPGVDQRYCVRHLYSNFRKQYLGKDLKRLMWSAATATYPQLWKSEMRKIKEVNVDAFKYLIAISPRFWSRSRFTPTSHCDTLVNNMCEGFNSGQSDQLFEVIHISQFGEQFVVNLDNKDCSCRKWFISGIPCTHVITAMKFLNLNAEDYIRHWFRKSTYEETYNIIYSINGQHVWDITPYPDVLPPKKKEMPRRPKKKQRL